MILSNGQAVPSQIDTVADTTPMFADASYYPNVGVRLTGHWAAYGALYRAQLWVNTVVSKLAFAAARLPLDTLRHGEGTDQEAEIGPLSELLGRPNARLDAFKLWLWTSSTYDIYGEAFWLKLRDQNMRVREIHPIHPTNLILRRNEDGSVDWVYSSGVRNVSMLPAIPEADIVPFVNYNPDNLARGLSKLEPLRSTLMGEDSARRATASWWDRGARPALMIAAPKALSQGAYDRLAGQVDKVHGGVDNAGGTLVLEEGAKPFPVQLSAEEMQYIESRKLNREEVCAAYDVPPPVVHILDKATFSNITEQMRSMYRDTMAPRLALFESAINHHLVPDFDKSGEVFTRFNMDEVMRGDFETRAKAAVSLVGAGLLKPNEGRPMFSLPPAGPVGDKLYANAAIQELGKPGERVTVTATAPASPGETQEIQEATDEAAQQQDEAAAGRQRQPAEKPPPVRRGGRPQPRSDSRSTSRRGRWHSAEEDE